MSESIKTQSKTSKKIVSEKKIKQQFQIGWGVVKSHHFKQHQQATFSKEFIEWERQKFRNKARNAISFSAIIHEPYCCSQRPRQSFHIGVGECSGEYSACVHEVRQDDLFEQSGLKVNGKILLETIKIVKSKKYSFANFGCLQVPRQIKF